MFVYSQAFSRTGEKCFKPLKNNVWCRYLYRLLPSWLGKIGSGVNRPWKRLPWTHCVLGVSWTDVAMWRRSATYGGARLWMTPKVNRSRWRWKRCLTGSQWRACRMGVMWGYESLGDEMSGVLGQYIDRLLREKILRMTPILVWVSYKIQQYPFILSSYTKYKLFMLKDIFFKRDHLPHKNIRMHH